VSGTGAASTPVGASRTIAGRTWADTGVILVLSVIGMAGFGSAFDSGSYLVAGAGGLLVVAAAVLLCTRLGFGVVLTVAASIVVWYLFGSAIALPGESLFGALPTLPSLAGLSIGAVDGWSDILTLRAPVSLPEYINAVPYAAGGVVSLVTVLLASRWLPRRRRTALRSSTLLVGPVALYVASVLLGTDQPYFAGLRGIAFAALALVWLGWRRREGGSLAVAGGGALLRRKLLGTGIVVVVAVLVGVFVGGAIAPPASARFVLRDRVQPPFQPLTYPSPLAGFRHYTKALDKSTLFTVSGLKSGQTLRLASLDSYNGEIWGVAGAQQSSDASGSFDLVGRHIPPAPLDSPSTRSTISVTVDDYSDVWIPDTGYAQSLSLGGSSGSTALENVRYNDATGTAVLTTGLRKGDSYTVTDEVPKIPADAKLKNVPVAAFAPALVSDTPDAVVAKAQQIAGKATSPIAKLRAIQQYLVSKGYFSHGTASDQVASSAGHGADRMYAMVTQPTMVGDQEQYASLFALMARSFGYPVRVVMGFDPKVTDDSGAPVKITGDDVTAWDEVAFQGVGWVPFFPTPKNPDVPQSQVPKPASQPQPQVRQPARTNSDPDDLVTPVQISKTKKHKKDGLVIPGWVIGTGIGIAIPVVVVFVPILVVAEIKSRRRRRRRAASGGDRVAAGAWDELLDQFSELGYAIPARTTRIHTASGLERQISDEPSALGAVALLTDDAVFSGRAIEQEAADRVWADALAAVDDVRSRASRTRRILARYRLSAVRAWAARVVSVASAQSDSLLRTKK
jgi:transglutaminase-like putative cysteine protease